jgi:hypothetical protein
MLNVYGTISFGLFEAAALILYLSSRCALDYLNVVFQTLGDLAHVRRVALVQALVTAPVIALCAVQGATVAIAGFGAVIWAAGVVPLAILAHRSKAVRAHAEWL